MRSGKDETLMLQPYPILLLEVFNEDRIQRLPRSLSSIVCAVCWISNSILQL